MATINLPTPDTLRTEAWRHWHHDTPDLLAPNPDNTGITAITRVANGLRALPLAPIPRPDLLLSDILSLVPLAHHHWPHYHRIEGTRTLAAWCRDHPAPRSDEAAAVTAAWRTATPTAGLREAAEATWHGTPWQGTLSSDPATLTSTCRPSRLPAPWHRRVVDWDANRGGALHALLVQITEGKGPWPHNPESTAHAGWQLTHRPPDVAALLESLAAHPPARRDGAERTLHALWSLPAVGGQHTTALIAASRANRFKPTARCLLRWRVPSPALWAGFWDLVGMGDPTLPWLTPAVAPALWHPGVPEAQRRGVWGELVSSTERAAVAPRGVEGVRLAHALWIASEALDATDMSTRHLVAGWRGATHPLVARAAKRFSLLVPQESTSPR